MLPSLTQVTLDGPSRHRLLKGFILASGRPAALDPATLNAVVEEANRQLQQQDTLKGFGISSGRGSTIILQTPFHPVYSIEQRTQFINKLVRATLILMACARAKQCLLIAAGVNPYFQDEFDNLPTLCADIHQIEVFDNGEVERIYNLFRQFLPELIALSTHASLYAGQVQRDFSLRMRVNPSSFLPRYISQFDAEQLRRLHRMIRKEFGLASLQHMDINPLVGNFSEHLLNNDNPAAVELRFMDAQFSYAFIRAQVILLQAIAIYGRTLARQGKRLPFMRDDAIDENKALAIKAGTVAVLKPDAKFNKGGTGQGYWYHDRGESERSTTALLSIMNGLLIAALQSLRTEAWELAPLVVGAELRLRGKRCLANYAEFQQYVYYTHKERFPGVLQQSADTLLADANQDALVTYNREQYRTLSDEILLEWTDKLSPKPRVRGSVKWFDSRKGNGFLIDEDGTEYPINQDDIEGAEGLTDRQIVSFEVGTRRGKIAARRVRIEQRTGRVTQFDSQRNFGFIVDDNGERIFVHGSEVRNRRTLFKGDLVTFECVTDSKGLRAVAVSVKETRSTGKRTRGTVKWFDRAKRIGFLVTPEGKEVFVHANDLDGVAQLEQGQGVSFEIEEAERGPKAVLVRVEKDS